MFLSQDSYEKYSFCGTFEKQLNCNEYNKHEKEFDIFKFLQSSGGDIQWYTQLNHKLIDKEQKLRRPFQHHRYHEEKRQQKRDIESQSSIDKRKISESINQNKIIANENKTSNFDYNPKSPDLPESSIEPTKPSTSYSTQTKSQANETSERVDKIPAQKAHPLHGEKATATPEQKQTTRQTNKSPVISYDRRSNELIKQWYPLRFKLAYPRVSRLKPAEQKEFIELHTKFRLRTKVTNAEVKFYKKYLHYRTLVEKERQEFFVYLKDYYKHAKEDYDFMNPSTTRYIEEMIGYLENYTISFDRYYAPQLELKINEHEDVNHKCTFALEKNLLQLGNLPKIILPAITLEKQPFLNIDYGQMSKRIPVSKNSKKLSKIPLHQDSNAEKLALKYDCSVVMSSSAFVNLIYNLSLVNTDDIEMPVIIKECRETDNSVKKIIYIEKPFVQKYLSKREKNEKFYKRALLVTLVKQSNMNMRNRRGAVNIKTNPASENQSDQSVEMEKSFDSTAPHKRKLEQSNNVDYESLIDLESFGCLDDKNKQTINSTTPKKSKPSNTTPHIEEMEISHNSPIKSNKLNENCAKNDIQTSSLSVHKNEIKNKTEKKNSNKSNPSSRNESGNESYDEYSEDESQLLIIDQKEDNIDKNQSITETPSSPPPPELPNNLSTEILFGQINTKMLQQSIENVPKSPSLESQHEAEELQFKPKVIPLNKLEEDISKKQSIEKISKIAAESAESKTVPNEEKLSLFDLISKMQEKLINTPLNTINPTQPSTSNSHLQASKVQNLPVENAKDFVYIENIHDNVNYGLWSFNLKNKPIKILIRSSSDGYVNTESSAVNNVVLYPKLEYQPQFGCETLSIKDCCKMWSKSFLRNCCDILLCRINTFTNKLISITSFKHADILTPNCGFNPNQTFHHLRSLFERLLELETNNYLIAKQPNEPKINVMRSEKSKLPGLFDLHFFFNTFKVVENNEKPSCWLPIDPELYLPYHYKLNRVPCLFDPVFDFSKGKKSSPDAADKSSGKKSRKKNYRKKQNIKKAKV